MKNRRIKTGMFVTVAAMSLSMCLVAPTAVYATQTSDTDVVDDEFEAGDQETVAGPGAGTDTDSRHNSGSSSSSGGSSSSSSSSGSSTGSGSSSSSSAGSTTTSSTSGTGTARSSDSSLAHLGISPGSISPAFSAGTHAYTATVDADVTAISVAARPNDSKAVIASVTGAKTLSPGTNTVKVVVSAENGTTTTYTITVTCGSASAAAGTPADTAASDGDTDTTDVVEGEITDPDSDAESEGDAENDPEQNADVTFDDNGYLIYEGNAYIPSSMMPEGDYVSLDKYNKLYEQSQSQKSKYTRMIIILAVLLLVVCSVLLNLALKLRDLKQDARLGLNGIDDDDGGKSVKAAGTENRTENRKENRKVHKRSAAPEAQTDMIPDLKIPESVALEAEHAAKPVKAAKTHKTEKAVQVQKPVKPEKTSRFHKAEQDNDDLEILDLNDL